ncbi:MAG: hypothetical protein ACLFST_04930 [Spirochaetia bacterium]
MTEKTQQELLEKQDGISEEEKQEIHSHIEKIALENRIKAAPGLFSLKGTASGILFPLLINGAAVLIVGAVIVFLMNIYRQDELRVKAAGVAYVSLEGRLIRELQQESQSFLAENQRKISSAEQKLANVEQQLKELRNRMETEIAGKEEEYSEALREDIENERSRLRGQGYSPEKVTELVSRYESNQRRFYREQLESYSNRITENQSDLLAELATEQAELKQQLTELKTERETILADYETREDTLRQEFAADTKVMENKTAAPSAELEKARQELAVLNKEKQTEDTIRNIVIGQFNLIRQALTTGNIDDGLDKIGSLRDYLLQPAVASVTAISNRREVDLFILNTLESMIQEQQEQQTDPDTLMEQLELFTELRMLLEQANEAFDTGDFVTGETFFRKAITRIPEMAAAHDFIVEQQRSDTREETRHIVEGEWDAEKERERSAFDAAVSKAAASLSAGDYTGAVAYYTEALEYPQATDPDMVVTSLIRAGYNLNEYLIQDDPRPSLRTAAESAGIDLDRDRAAFDSKIRKAVRNREKELAVKIASLEEELSSLQSRYKTEIKELKIAAERNTEQDKASDPEPREEPGETAEEVRKELEVKFTEEKEELTGEISSQLKKIQDLEEKIGTYRHEIDQLKGEVTRLSLFEELTERTSDAFREYRKAEAEARAGGSADALLKAKFVLDEFLRSGPIQKVMPDIDKDIRTYDQAFEEAGREGAILDTTELVSRLLELETREQKVSYMTEQLEDAESPEMGEFINVLRNLLVQ